MPKLSRRRDLMVGALGILTGAAIWEIVGANTERTFFAPLSATLASLAEMVEDGSLVEALGSSLALYAAGLVLAIVAGVGVGLLLARRDLLRTAVEDYVTALYATPMVALIPFVLAVFGFGFGPKVLVVFLFAVFPILLNTLEGARSVGKELLDVARAYRSTERQLWRHVIFPYTLPFAMTGVRQGMARGLVGVIAAEFFLSSSGLGQMIIINSQRFDTPAVLASVLVITIIGVALMGIGTAIESRFARWRVTS